MKKEKKEEQKQEDNTLPCVTGKFYTVCKVDSMLSLSYEIEVYQGIVVSVKQISKSEDLACIVIGQVQHLLWQSMRDQKKEKMFARQFDEKGDVIVENI